MVIDFPFKQFEKFKNEIKEKIGEKFNNDFIFFLFQLYQQLAFESTEQFGHVLSYVRKFKSSDIKEEALQKIKEEIRKEGVEKVGLKEKSYWEEEEDIVGMRDVPNFILDLCKKKVPQTVILKCHKAVTIVERLARLSWQEIVKEKRKKK